MNDSPQSIGAYTVLRELGRGGMGVVYLATDPKLNRNVAIKVLPDVVAQDPERLARFEREARLLASLNHPHIAGIYGLEEADGQRFLVLEFLEGESLAARLDGGPLRAAEAIHVCKQIAAALEAAHEAGIIHRDLKPANVMITDDDQVKVLDFGLAKGDGSAGSDSSSAASLSASPTVAVGATGAGMILGTAAYMSPEQARGRSVDRRTDIWSFGAVLFECLTGKQLFGGDTASDVIAKILEREPDWDALPKDTPDRVRELIRRCLEKKARERMRDMGDARIELEEVESGKTSSISGMTAGVPEAEVKSKLRMAWGVAGVAAVIAIVMAGMNLGRTSAPPQPLTRLQIVMPPELDLTGAAENVVCSPDGSTLAMVASDTLGDTRIYLRDMGSLDLRPLPGTESAAHPFWSPDGQHIGFFSEAKLRRVSIDDGQVEVIADVNSPRGGTWGEDHILFAGAQGPIFSVAPEGGDVQAATEVDTVAGETAHRFPYFLPDGKTFLYAALPPSAGLNGVMASDVNGRAPVEIMRARGRPEYAGPGYLVWKTGRRIVSQGFDASTLKLSGKPTTIGSTGFGSGNLGAPCGTAASSGALVYLTPNFPTTQFVWVDEAGNTRETLDVEEKLYVQATISPDGKTIATTVLESEEESDLWLIDTERMTPTRLTFGKGLVALPQWAPDSKRLVFVSDRDGPMRLYIINLDRPDQPQVIDPGAMFANPMGWGADGSHILFTVPGTGTGIDMWVARIDGDTPELRPFIATPFNESNAGISPDGRWVTYSSDESGRFEVYVTSFPQAGRKYRVSTEGGQGPGFSHDGRRIYFGSPDGWIMRADVETGDTFRVTRAPRRAGQLPQGLLGMAPSPSDHRWLMVLPASEPVDASLTVVTGWQSEVEN